jgi:hypothetical protein
MSCCNGDDGAGQWRFLPDDRQIPTFTVLDGGRGGQEEQPKAPAAKHWPWWAWVVVALVALHLMRGATE